MVLIAATGNYCFFNLLTVALCVLLLDDAALQRFVPARWRELAESTCNVGGGRDGSSAPLAGVVLLVTTMNLLASHFEKRFRGPTPW